MELSEFVSNTLKEVLQGIANAQTRARELNAYVNPTIDIPLNSTARLGKTATDHAVYAIDFDVAVTVVESKDAEAGGKLAVASMFSLGGSVRDSDRLETISRVRFSVPITYPVDQASTDERADKEARQKAERDAETQRIRNAASGGRI